MSENKKNGNSKIATSSVGMRRGGQGGPGMFGPGMMIPSKPKHFKTTMKKLIAYIAPFKAQILVVIFFAIASTLFTIASPKILGNMTNDIVNEYVSMKAYDSIMSQLPKGTKLPTGTTGEDILRRLPPNELKQIPSAELNTIKNLNLSQRPSIDFGKIGSIALILIILYILSSLFIYIQGWIMTGVTQKITYKFRKDISDKINRIPLKYFDSQPFGDVLSRVTNDVDNVSQTLNQSITQILTSITTVIGILIMMLTISWELTLIALLMLPLSFACVAITVKKSQNYFKSQQDTLGIIDGHIEEIYGGHNLVKVFNGEQTAISKFKSINMQLYENAWKSQFFSGLMWPIMSFIGNIGYVAVSVVGGWFAVKGMINIGDIQAFIQYVNQFNQPVMQSANIANVLQSTAASAERIFEFLEEPEEIAEDPNPEVIKNVQGKVEFNNVIFGYTEDKTIIKGFNVQIEPGQRVAIVGPTGAGKTTIVNLLMRFYDVNEGSIKIDGVDIRNMRRSDLRKIFGMVLQDTWLFNGTIKENIKYGRLDASEEDIVKAAEAAHADHFIRALPNGYDLELNEEADNISQGEKQLLTIARAMLANPPMLILDEATSSVDTRTEVLIQKAMDNLMHGRTSFVIAHRLSTIRDADLILVMKDGNIIEQGKHNELLAQNGFYASLYNSQFEEREDN